MWTIPQMLDSHKLHEQAVVLMKIFCCGYLHVVGFHEKYAGFNFLIAIDCGKVVSEAEEINF